MMEDNVFFLHKVSLPGLDDAFQNVLHLHFLEEFRVEVAFDDETAELTLLQTFLENVLFDGVDRDESVDVDCLSLTNSMAPVLSLFIHSRVPVGVIKDDTISTCEVDADTTASCRGNEAEELWVKVEPVNHLLASFDFDRSIKSHVGVPV